MIKTYQSFALALLLGAGIIFSPGCKKPCKDVICENSGTEREDGDNCVCDCLTGYEGERCEIQVRKRFTHIWSGSDACGAENKIYMFRIVNGSTVDQIKIENLSDFGANQSVNATVNDTASFTIDNFTSGGKVYNGTGKLTTDNNLNMEYTMTQNGMTITCSGTFEIEQ